ncbi:MAG: LytR C-terminal domain-containing protein [Actinomycetota bacterium]|nr:LytR C-terminal domain-containing protein [Actinomycetota bacterium]
MNLLLRDERGVVLPTRLMVLSVSVIAIAGAAYAITAPPQHQHRAETVHSRTHLSKPKVTAHAKAKPRHKAPAVKRNDVYVAVYNNSPIHGLAAQTAARAAGAGWKVVGSDNWYGTIPVSTVYYPPRLRAAAKQLARDLGITRMMPAVAPMQFDRLTVILTSSYH